MSGAQDIPSHGETSGFRQEEGALHNSNEQPSYESGEHHLGHQNSGYPEEKTGFRDNNTDTYPVGEQSGSAAAHPNRHYGMDGSKQQGQSLAELAPGQLHNIKGTSHIPGEDNQTQVDRNRSSYVAGNQEEAHFQRPQGEEEYPGRDYAQVVPHSTYNRISGDGAYDQNRPQEHVSSEEREAEQQRGLDNENEEPGHGGFAGVGAIGSSSAAGSRFPHEQLQPSRSYIAESRPATVVPRPDDNFGQQGEAGQQNYATHDLQREPSKKRLSSIINPFNKEPSQKAKSQRGVSRQPSYAGTQKTSRTATQPTQQQGHFIENDIPPVVLAPMTLAEHKQPYQQGQPEQATVQNGHVPQQPGGQYHDDGVQNDNRQSYIAGQHGPTTGVQPVNTMPPVQDGYVSRGRPVSGGGLAAALATSGHAPTKDDKKDLRKELKAEKVYEKGLKKEAHSDRVEIEAAIKQAKSSTKKAEKSAAYELSFRRTYEKSIKKEVQAKQRLLKITNEYNKVAADLERATKEMEIRRNNHLADEQTRDADHFKVDDLRARKGQNDMDREAKHGESLTKQSQAKRALSMSARPKSAL